MKYKRKNDDPYILIRPFDKTIKKHWSCEFYIQYGFMELYIKKKYNSIMHSVSFTELIISEKNNISRVSLIDWSNECKLCIKDRESLKKYYDAYRNTDKRYTYYKVKQIFNHSAHALFILYDKKINSLMLFNSIECDYYLYSKPLLKFFKNIYGSNIKIIYPFSTEDYSGLELDETDMEPPYLFISKGWCCVWAFWYLEEILLNPDYPNLSGRIYGILSNSNIKIGKMIRGYAQFMDKINSGFIIENQKYNIRFTYKDNISLIVSKKNINKYGFYQIIVRILKKLNFSWLDKNSINGT